MKATAAILIMMVVAAGCNKPNEQNNGGNNGNNDGDVRVTTYIPQDITATTAICGGDVITVQGLSLSSIGVCWGTENNPTIDDTCVFSSRWNEPFVCTLYGLEPETQYYVRAYALRGLMCYYGEVESFTTSIVAPPLIQILQGDSYVYDGQVINIGTDYIYGIRVASNTQTNKELATLKLSVSLTDMNDVEYYADDTTINISGTEYTYQEPLNFSLDRDELISKFNITATVTDVDGNMNSLTTHLVINLPEEPLTEEPLTEVDFEWYRCGNEQTGLEEYGLYWYRNAKSPFAEIKPLDGVLLYKFNDSSVWDEIESESQKAALFSNSAVTAAIYNDVDVSQNSTYDDLIGTRMPDGSLHLIHVELFIVGSYTPAGTPFTIYGKAK